MKRILLATLLLLSPKLQAHVDTKNLFVIPAAEAKEMLHIYGIKEDELLLSLLPLTQPLARAPISHEKVGAAVMGKSGTIYLGVNLEFPGVPLHESVHAEQFAIANARRYGETEITTIAISAAPCGHCRQFMQEIEQSGKIRVVTASFNKPLDKLLPHAGNTQNRDAHTHLLTPSPPHMSLMIYSLDNEAREAYLASYAPYSKCPSGVAIQVKSGQIYRGAYLENRAFNPSLSPLQAALIALIADMSDYAEILSVLLVEKPNALISHEATTRAILKNIAPQAHFSKILQKQHPE